MAKNPKALGLVDEREPAPAAGVNALLGRGSSFEGKLVFEGTVHINGTFVGEIRSNDTLVVGEGAKVQGDLQVGTLIINGDVSGQIRAKQLIEMHAPARVKGSVFTPVLVVERGVVFEGTTAMENLEAPPPKPVKAG